MSLADVLDLSNYEIALWEAEFRLSPWDEFRSDLQAGMIAATIANVNRGKNTPAFSPADFMPYLEKEKPVEGKDDYDSLKGFIGG